jgi:hypothetical protein
VSEGARIIYALKARLESIKTANGYPMSVREVSVNVGEITFDLPSNRLPLIEVIQAPERYEHEACGAVEIVTSVILRLVDERPKTDPDMEFFKSSVIRAIYGNSYNATGNTGIGLEDGQGRSIIFPRLVSCETDLNMVPGNRIYALLFELRSRRQTWKF